MESLTYKFSSDPPHESEASKETPRFWAALVEDLLPRASPEELRSTLDLFIRSAETAAQIQAIKDYAKSKGLFLDENTPQSTQVIIFDGVSNYHTYHKPTY